MKKIYVTEDSLARCTTQEELINNHSQTNWQVSDISDLITKVIDSGTSFDRDDIGISVEIIDTEELANWVITNGLESYNRANTLLDELSNSYHLQYQGENYNLVILIDDILTDFILNAIDSISSLESVPTGLQITKYD